MNSNYYRNKLAAYSSTIAGLIIPANLNAQIVYTDIDPDEQLSAWGDDAFAIDFNDDGLGDVTIAQDLWDYGYCDSSTSGVWCEGYTYQRIDANGVGADFVNNFPGSTVYGLHSATPLSAGDVISIDANWNESGYARLFEGDGGWVWYWDEWWGEGGWVDVDYQFGQWHNVDHKYLGVSFLIDGLTHYGWIEMSADSTEEIQQIIRIYSFAYETTPGAPIIAGMIPDCFPPEPLGAAAITGTTAKLKWTAAAEVDHYELQYRPVGAAIWTTKNVPGIKTFRKVVGLLCDTEYEWQIRSICTDGEVSLYSEMQTFTTASCRMENENVIDEENIEIYSYANQLFVNFEEDIIEPGSLLVYDILGRVVSDIKIKFQQNVFDLGLPSGTYIVKLDIQGNQYIKTVNLNL